MAKDFEFGDEEQPDASFWGESEGDGPGPRPDGDLQEKEVKVVGVYEHVEQGGSQPTAFVVLRDSQGRSVLIVIGKFEAMAISLALEGHSADRPLPYDLLNNIVEKIGGNVERILIDDLWNNTYYAKVGLAFNGKTLDVDSRPSDAIALGLRARAPIYMAESVLEKAAVQEE